MTELVDDAAAVDVLEVLAAPATVVSDEIAAGVELAYGPKQPYASEQAARELDNERVE